MGSVKQGHQDSTQPAAKQVSALVYEYRTRTVRVLVP